MITSLSELEEPTVHQVFDVYDTLFDHIEFSMNKLQCKRIEWKVKIQNDLGNAHQKLQHYYSATYQSEGYIYVMATILNPQSKLSHFAKASWLDDWDDWVAIYHQAFVKIYEHYQAKDPEIAVKRVHSAHISHLDHTCDHIQKKCCLSHNLKTTNQFVKIETYLKESKYCLIFVHVCFLTTLTSRVCEYLSHNLLKNKSPSLLYPILHDLRLPDHSCKWCGCWKTT